MGGGYEDYVVRKNCRGYAGQGQMGGGGWGGAAQGRRKQSGYCLPTFLPILVKGHQDMKNFV